MIAWEYPGGAELDRLVMECGGLSGRDEERIEYARQPKRVAIPRQLNYLFKRKVKKRICRQIVNGAQCGRPVRAKSLCARCYGRKYKAEH